MIIDIVLLNVKLTFASISSMLFGRKFDSLIFNKLIGCDFKYINDFSKAYAVVKNIKTFHLYLLNIAIPFFL